MNNDTEIYDIDLVDEALIKETLIYVSQVLRERGYNPISQIVGYLVSGDLGYISSYKEARNRISKLDKNKIMEELLNSYLK